jgi:hypothetical protein
MGLTGYNLFSVFRRGLWRAAEVQFLIQVTDALGITENLFLVISQHLIAYVAVTIAGSGMYDIFDIILRPHTQQTLDPPCNDVPELLDNDTG